MNRILISILGVIVVGVSLYYIAFSNGDEGATAELEVEELDLEENSEETAESNEVELLNEEEIDSIVEQPVAYQENQEKTVKEIIAKQHHYLNKLAGWGNADTLDYEALQNNQEWQKLKKDIEWLKESGFAESVVLTDMGNAKEFMNVASSGDSKSLLYLHRIFHDLDAEINDQEVDKIWNVTHAFGNQPEQDQLLSYLSTERGE
jgi:flagellar basal body-associated protein FliL